MAQSPDTEMTWADQLVLNKFASENNRRHVLNAEIENLKEQITSWNDAKEEVELSVEDDARIKVGEVYMVMSQDDVVASIDAKIAALEKNKAALEAELDVIATHLAEYKSELYGKFGTDNINLED